MNTATMTQRPVPAIYPISLINTELKIITRIETATPVLIHPDQTGFIKNRHASDNT